MVGERWTKGGGRDDRLREGGTESGIDEQPGWKVEGEQERGKGEPSDGA
jgi:hypothetical protein